MRPRQFALKASSYTWAGKPAAASYPIGQPIFISDVGGWNGTTHSGSFWFSNGTLWRPVSGVLMLASLVTSAPASVNTTSEQTVYSYTLQGGVMAVGDSIRVTGKFNYAGSTGVTVRGKYNTSNFFGQAGVSYGYGIFQHSFHNRATSTQVVGILETHNYIGSFNTAWNGGTTPQITTISVDSSVDNVITLTMQKTTGTDAISLESLQIELLAG